MTHTLARRRSAPCEVSDFEAPVERTTAHADFHVPAYESNITRNRDVALRVSDRKFVLSKLKFYGKSTQRLVRILVEAVLGQLVERGAAKRKGE